PGLRPGPRPGTWICEADGALMVRVPAGVFIMGAPRSSSSEDAEGMPAHEVVTGAFFVDVYEVTNRQYARFLAAVAQSGHATCPRDEPAQKDHRPLDWGTEDYAARSPGEDYPVCGLDWFDARAYCAWAGKRLPT